MSVPERVFVFGPIGFCIFALGGLASRVLRSSGEAAFVDSGSTPI